MSAKTKIVVLHMKELIYTLIFAGLGILLIFLLLFMFLPGKEDGESVETMRYVAGVYTSSIQFGEHAVDMQVIVDENRIQSVSMVNLDETVDDNVSADGAGIGKHCGSGGGKTDHGRNYIQCGLPVYVSGIVERD